MRAARCTASPATSSPVRSTSPVCRPVRSSRPAACAAAMTCWAQRTPWAGPVKSARTPSPVVLTVCPPWASTAARVSARCRSSRAAQARSPALAARRVESTRSVKRTVARTRFVTGAGVVPVTNSSIGVGESVGLAHHDEHVGARELTEPRAGDEVGELAHRLARDACVRGLQHQRRRLHEREDRGHVAHAGHVEQTLDLERRERALQPALQPLGANRVGRVVGGEQVGERGRRRRARPTPARTPPTCPTRRGSSAPKGSPGPARRPGPGASPRAAPASARRRRCPAAPGARRRRRPSPRAHPARAPRASGPR